MSDAPSITVIAQSTLAHVCTRPDQAVPDGWVEALVAADRADWLARAAERTMIAGLLWSALTPTQRALLPESSRSMLQGLHLGNALRWQAYRKLLIDSARSLDDADIPVAPLKGAALLLEVYSEPGERTMSDLDLLVPEEYLAAAYEVLSHGAEQVNDRHPDRHLGTIWLAGETGRIELHGTGSHEALWPGTGDPFTTGRRITLEGARLIMLDDTNLWLHVACHGLDHFPSFWPRMAADLARLQRLPGWDQARWETIWQAARGHHCERTVLLAATMADGGRVPAELREVGVPEADCRAAEARALEAWGIAATAPARDFGPWARRWIADSAGRDREVLAHLFPPRAVLMERHRISRLMATVLYPVYVLRRGARLAGNGLAWWGAWRMRHYPGMPDHP